VDIGRRRGNRGGRISLELVDRSLEAGRVLPDLRRRRRVASGFGASRPQRRRIHLARVFMQLGQGSQNGGGVVGGLAFHEGGQFFHCLAVGLHQSLPLGDRIGKGSRRGERQSRDGENKLSHEVPPG